AGVGARVDDHAETGVGNPLLPGQARGDLKNLADNRVVVGLDVEHARDMLARNDENVHRRLWLDIPEGNDAIVLVEDTRVDLSFHQGAKQTAIHARLLKFSRVATVSRRRRAGARRSARLQFPPARFAATSPRTGPRCTRRWAVRTR